MKQPHGAPAKFVPESTLQKLERILPLYLQLAAVFLIQLLLQQLIAPVIFGCPMHSHPMVMV
ncbi:MAG: hypothetical protein R2807_04395 [Chitinophagales bacterium]